MDPKGDDATWRLLVKRVAVARAMCSLARRKRPEILRSSVIYGPGYDAEVQRP